MKRYVPFVSGEKARFSNALVREYYRRTRRDELGEEIIRSFEVVGLRDGEVYDVVRVNPVLKVNGKDMQSVKVCLGHGRTFPVNGIFLERVAKEKV